MKLLVLLSSGCLLVPPLTDAERRQNIETNSVAWFENLNEHLESDLRLRPRVTELKVGARRPDGTVVESNRAFVSLTAGSRRKPSLHCRLVLKDDDWQVVHAGITIPWNSTQDHPTRAAVVERLHDYLTAWIATQQYDEAQQQAIEAAWQQGAIPLRKMGQELKIESGQHHIQAVGTRDGVSLTIMEIAHQSPPYPD